MNFGEVRRAQVAKSTLLISSLVCPWDRFRSFKVCSERVGCGKQPHLFIPSKTITYVPEFVIEDLPLGRIAALVLEFTVKDVPLGRTLMMMMSRCKMKRSYG